MKKVFYLVFPALVFLYCNLSAQNTLYVSLSGSNTSPYSSWATAATNIQEAVDAAATGDIIIVNDGTYTLSAPLSVTKSITIKSKNGYTSSTINGNHLVQCFNINNSGAVIDGFTITNGYNPSGFGGGANIVSGGTIQNCLISNSQARDGGGVAIDNSGLVFNCIVTGNIASDNGSQGYGGGIRMLSGGIARNCLVYNNSSIFYGGGINIWDAGTIQNCTIVNNTAPNGAGVRCRGLSVMENTISYFNNGLNWQTEGSSYSFSNNCTTPALPSGSGNITSDPKFVNSSANDFHLLVSSPAINTGINETWMTGAKDLDGNNRIFNSTVDMGSYEYCAVPPAVPTLISPAHCAGGVSIEIKLTWSSLSGATYTLQVATDVSFNNLVINQSGLTSAEYDLTGLSNSTDYFWRVSTEKNLLTSGFSSGFKFTCVTLSHAVLSWPTGDAFLYSSPAYLSWYVSEGGTGWKYDLIYSTDINMASPTVVSNLTTASYTLTGLLPGTAYYWKIRLKTSTGAVVSYSSKESFVTSGGVVKPVASTPTGGMTIYTLSPILYWYLNEAAISLTYEVEVRQGATTTLTGTATSLNISSQFISISGLLPGKEYSWHVRSKSGSQYSDWSDAETFYTIATSGPVVPVLSWPIGGNIVYTSSPTLYWYLNSSSAGLTYQLEYVEGLTTSFTGTPNVTNITCLSNTLVNLTAGKNYKWRVRSYDGTSTSAWSSEETFSIFSTGTSGPIVPTPSWPIGGATVYSTSVQLDWYLGAFVQGLTYDIELRSSSLNGTPTLTNITSLWQTINGLTPGTIYYWHVRSVCGGTASAWSDTESFTTINSSVTATVPILSWPIGGATVYTNSPSLSWYLNSPSGGITYQLQYCMCSNMDVPVTLSGLTSGQVTLNGLSAGTVYYWRVRSFDGTVYSSYSAIESFVTSGGVNALVVPVAQSPAKGITIDNPAVMLSWFLPTAGDAVSYEVQYANNAGMQNASDIILNSQSQLLNGLEGGTTYYWRVRSINSSGETSAYSNIEKFTPEHTTGITGTNEIPSTFLLKQNYPNPFNPSTILEFSIPVAGNYTLDVYNVLGEKVTTLLNTTLNPGTFKVAFNGKNFSSGVYFYRLSGNKVNLIRKMLMLK